MVLHLFKKVNRINRVFYRSLEMVSSQQMTLIPTHITSVNTYRNGSSSVGALFE